MPDHTCTVMGQNKFTHLARQARFACHFIAFGHMGADDLSAGMRIELVVYILAVTLIIGKKKYGRIVFTNIAIIRSNT